MLPTESLDSNNVANGVGPKMRIKLYRRVYLTDLFYASPRRNVGVCYSLRSLPSLSDLRRPIMMNTQAVSHDNRG